jgi:hypothetical protein
MITETTNSISDGRVVPNPPVKRGRGRPRKGEEPEKRRKSSRLPTVKAPRVQFTIRMRESVLRLGKRYTDDNKVHFTDLVEEGILQVIGEKSPIRAWHKYDPEVRELAEAFAEFMQAKTSEVQNGVKQMMKVVLRDFVTRKQASG